MDKHEFQDKTLNIDVTDYWLIIQKRFLQIVVVFFIVVVVTLYITLTSTPVYQAECKIRITARQPMATIEGAQITWYGSRGNEIGSEIELIRTKDEILNSVIEILRKKTKSRILESSDREYFTSKEIKDIESLSLTSPKEIAELDKLSPAALRGSIEIEPVSQSDIIAIRLTGSQPELVKAAANVLAIVYKADFWRAKTQDARDTREFIKGQLDDIIRDLEKNRESMQKSTEANVHLGEMDVYKAKLSELRIELGKLKESYQESHPRVQKLKNLIASIEEQLAKFPKTKQSYDDSVSEWEIMQSLRKSLGEYYLKANIDYEAKKQKAKDEIQIVSKAQNAYKLKPNEIMNIFVGCIFGVILSIVYAFVWEGIDTSIGKIEDVERITGLPVIAHVPLIGGGKTVHVAFFRPAKIILKRIGALVPFFKRPEEPLDLDKKILFNFDPLSVTAEAYRTLRTNIQFAIGTGKRTGNVIGITSASPREGKTLTATNLSIALAQMGKMTLLLEADMRRPQIAALFKIDGKKGLSDLLIGTVKTEEVIRTSADMLMGSSEWEKLVEIQGLDNLHVVACGSSPPNPTELLLSSEFRELVSELRKKYDFVIIDTPPCLPVSDASIVGTVVDGTVLIYQSDTTSRHLLLRAIQTLRKNQTKLLGIVINQLSFDVVIKSHKTAYGYGYYVKDE